MPFGYSLMIDMYGCDSIALDSMECHYRLMEDMVYLLGMTPMAPPICIHAPIKFIKCDKRYNKYEFIKVESFPDKAGISIWQPLVESGIQQHSCSPTKFSTIDIYSCNNFKDKIPVLKDILYDNFKFTDYEENFVIRGQKYGT